MQQAKQKQQQQITLIVCLLCYAHDDNEVAEAADDDDQAVNDNLAGCFFSLIPCMQWEQEIGIIFNQPKEEIN